MGRAISTAHFFLRRRKKKLESHRSAKEAFLWGLLLLESNNTSAESIMRARRHISLALELGGKMDQTESFRKIKVLSTLPCRKHMLQISGSIDEVGTVRPELAASLFGAWLIVFIALLKGVKSFGKVKYRFFFVFQHFLSFNIF